MSSRVDALRRARPRDPFLRGSLVVLMFAAVGAWMSPMLRPGASFFSATRLENLKRFWTLEVLPAPLRGESSLSLADWWLGLWQDSGAEALSRTFWIAVLATAIAMAFALLAAPLATRPDLTMESTPRWGRRVCAALVRGLAVFLRALPEYVWAFILLVVMGPSAWPAVIALAIHNGGILARLGAETIENLPPSSQRALRGLGASRSLEVLTAVFPAALPRFLIYVFYRFETCVREATVLGMLGVVSLGYFIVDARARFRYDEMLFYVVLGALLVVAADLLSWGVRSWLREGGKSRTQSLRSTPSRAAKKASSMPFRS